MNESIRCLLLILVIGLIVLVFVQSQYCEPVPNKGSLSLNNAQHFTVEDNEPYATLPTTVAKEHAKTKGLTNKEENVEKDTSNKEREKVTSQIVDSILKNEKNSSSELDSLLNQNEDQESEDFPNPMDQSINTETDHADSNSEVLDELMKEINTGNNLKVNSPEADVYRKKSTSINHAKKYRTLSYKDSGYRYDFNGNGDPTETSQKQLNNMYKEALIFKNNENTSNDNYRGFSQGGQTYGDANLKNFGGKENFANTNNEPQTQQEKVMSLYNSNEYLPNSDMTNNKLTKGFQILDNPVAVSNPNLIPVLKSIAVPSIMGSNKNMTYDIRSEPPCPKTAVSPFLNSDIMPDIYATQRASL
jgi:hypothetical protein